MQLHLTACLRFASLTQMPSALRKHAERYLKSHLREEIENARYGRIEREHRNNRYNG